MIHLFNRPGSACRLAFLLAACTLPGFGQSAPITAPLQPTTGPGGSDYLYSAVVQFGPFSSLEGSPTNDFMIFQPSGVTVPTLPVVFFLHGYLIGGEGLPLADDPVNYQGWINHLAQMGFTVIYPIDFDVDNSAPGRIPILITDLSSALVMLNSPFGGLIPPTTDSIGLQLVFAGHSYGAFDGFAVAQSLYLTPQTNLPPPRAIAAFNPFPGTHQPGELVGSISPQTAVVVVKSDEDAAPHIQAADQIWVMLKKSLPAMQRDFLEVITDSHGTPAQTGDHTWPLTNGYKDDATIDDRDYNVSFKLSVGLFNCVLAGTDCSYGLGHGDIDQINMGYWSDGTPVTPLLWNPPF